MTASSTSSVPAMGLWGNPSRRGKSAVLCCAAVLKERASSVRLEDDDATSSELFY